MGAEGHLVTVWKLLNCNIQSHFNTGIERLVAEEVFAAAYPLHVVRTTYDRLEDQDTFKSEIRQFCNLLFLRPEIYHKVFFSKK